MSRLFRVFGRRGGKAATRPDAAEDWQVGDLAECTYHGPWYRTSDGREGVGPALGDRDIVRAVFVGAAGVLMLSFSRFGDRSYDAHGFRKVRPQADELIAADATFIGAVIRRKHAEFDAEFGAGAAVRELAIGALVLAIGAVNLLGFAVIGGQ